MIGIYINFNLICYPHLGQDPAKKVYSKVFAVPIEAKADLADRRFAAASFRKSPQHEAAKAHQNEIKLEL